MKLNIFTFLILTLVIFNSQGNELYPGRLAEKVAKIALKEKDITLKEQLDITDKQDKEAPYSAYLFERPSGETFYVIITQAKGRYDMFDYLVAVNSKLEIERVRVLKYRSENGGEITSKKWLKQFIGYSGGDLRYKKEISALSGATLSAKAIIEDIPKSLAILRKNLK